MFLVACLWSKFLGVRVGHAPWFPVELMEPVDRVENARLVRGVVVFGEFPSRGQ